MLRNSKARTEWVRGRQGQRGPRGVMGAGKQGVKVMLSSTWWELGDVEGSWASFNKTAGFCVGSRFRRARRSVRRLLQSSRQRLGEMVVDMTGYPGTLGMEHEGSRWHPGIGWSSWRDRDSIAGMRRTGESGVQEGQESSVGRLFKVPVGHPCVMSQGQLDVNLG